MDITTPNYFGLLPLNVREDAVIDPVGGKVHIIIKADKPGDLRDRLLIWFEDEFFNYEPEPYIVGNPNRVDVATLRSNMLPKPILVTVMKRGA